MNFQIPEPTTSSNKSIRFPDELVAQMEQAIQGTDCTFSAFVIEATRVALENLREQQESQQ